MRLIFLFEGEHFENIPDVDYKVIPVKGDTITFPIYDKDFKGLKFHVGEVTKRHILYNKVGGIEFVRVYIKLL